MLLVYILFELVVCIFELQKSEPRNFLKNELYEIRTQLSTVYKTNP